MPPSFPGRSNTPDSDALFHPHSRAVAIWLIVCATMVLLIVVIGGVTRLTESGLSITEWKPVSGVIPPLSEAAWNAEFARYQQTQEYQQINRGMSISEFRNIYFWEYLHRLWGRLVGAVFAFPLLYFVIRGRIRGRQAFNMVGILVLIGLQGALGWYMVQSGLTERTDVSQYRLAAHLSLAVFIYALIVWAALSLFATEEGDDVSGEAIRGHVIATVALVSATIVSGAFVAGLNAGKAYNTFPLMAGRVVPQGYLTIQPWYVNLFENAAAVQFNHRLLAMTTFFVVMALCWRARELRLSSMARMGVVLLGVMALLQVALGIATLLTGVQIVLAALHQTGAVLLLTAAILALRGTVARRPRLAGRRVQGVAPDGYITLRTEGE